MKTELQIVEDMIKLFVSERDELIKLSKAKITKYNEDIKLLLQKRQKLKKVGNVA